MSSLTQHPIEEEYGYTMRSIRRPFNKKFSTIIGIFIGTLQMLLNGAIVGLEGGSVAYNPKIDIVYAGFWCSFSFFFTWISMFAFLFFRKTIRWGLVVAGLNFASIAFAIILIVFDSIFIQNPCRCYLATICDLDFADVHNCTGSDGKLRVITAQLACVVTMLVSNIGYIILFLIVVALSRVSYKPMSPSFLPMPSPYNSSPNVPIHTSTYQIPHQSIQYQLSYNSRYQQPTYPDETAYWRPSTPYLDRIEKF